MDIVFRTRKLARIFNSREALIREYGKPCARKIMIRMSVLRSAKDLSMVPSESPDRCHPLKGDHAGEFAVDLTHPFRLVFRPHNDDTSKSAPRKGSGTTVIEILRVEDYH